MDTSKIPAAGTGWSEDQALNLIVPSVPPRRGALGGRLGLDRGSHLGIPSMPFINRFFRGN
ncbi:MAG: hypothetical protein KAH96_02025 [Alphaproteobacteria bacterium]|nr:hypothetical protein [Alphaproteobacteria bacterium]